MKKRIWFIIMVWALSLPGALAAEVTIKSHHQDAGLSCQDCHESTPEEAVSIDRCVTCHELPEAKDNYQGEPDKHDSPHYGPDLECDNCHHEHQPSEDFCAECHDFNHQVP